MSLSKRIIILTVTLFLFLMLPCPAQTSTQQEEKKTELKQELRKQTKDETSSAELDFVEEADPRFKVKEIRISGNSLISTEKLRSQLPLTFEISVQEGEKTEVYDFQVLHDIILNPGKEYEVSITTIKGFTNFILSEYQKEGYAGIYVYVPKNTVRQTAQETTLVDNILQIHVLEGKVAKINVERFNFNRQTVEKGFLNESVLKSWSPVKEGEVIRGDKLDDFVDLLNLNPDRYISAVISKSADPNTLDLTYDVYEENPWHWYVQVDNSGTEERQWSPRIGITNTNLMGMDDSFSAMYQAPWESDIGDNYALFGSYNFPFLTPRLRFNFYGGYSEFDVTPQGGPFNFLGRGSFYGSVLSYNVLQIKDWFVDVTGSLSKENSKVTPAIGLASDVDMDLWGVGINVHRSSEFTNTSLTFNRIESMGGSSKSEFTSARLDADPDFVINNFIASHNQYLDTGKVNRIIGSLRWITSSKRLVPAKMTTFGGLYSVRGYEEDEIVADGGLLVSGQYEFDLVKHGESKENTESNLSQTERNKPWLRKLAPLAFIDFGRAKIKSPVLGEREVRELCSIGVGTIVEVGDNFSAGIYYGWPLRGTDETDSGDGRLNFSCIYRF
jgi:hemolysin activation/secretion protein